MRRIKMRKYSGLLVLFFLISCSSLPTKEVDFAKGELETAKTNQAPELAQKDYSVAEESFLAAEKFLKEEKGDPAKSEALKSLENSRTSILEAKEKRVQEKINRVNTLFEESHKLSMDNQKKEPAQKKFEEAQAKFEEGKGYGVAVKKDIQKFEPLPALDNYIKAMDEAYLLLEESEGFINQELEQLKKQAALYSTVTNGREIAQALQKDAFVSQFYGPELEALIQDFNEYSNLVKEGKVDEAEEKKEAYDKLVAFNNKMKEEKQQLGSAQQKITQNMIDKIDGFYKQDAESTLERARRLKEEVYKAYGRPEFQAHNPTTTEKNQGFRVLQPTFIEQKYGDDNNRAEDALFRQLDGLYQDAESYFENEEYTESIEKANESIELAEKMLQLKQSMAEKDTQNAQFQGQGIEGLTFKSYKVLKGDCLWKIAMRKSVYRKAYLWPLIWFANKDTVKDPDLIEPGSTLKIPMFQ